LKIFNVTDKTAIVLYPYEDANKPMLNDDKSKRFSADIKVDFPLNENMDGYYFGIDTPENVKEYNLLIFVYTKSNIPFMEAAGVTNIMKWIYEIPLNERAVEQYGIVVRR
jgi:hypothetical protein